MSVVGAVAKGSISSVGSITGDQAAEALTSYLGYSPVDSGSALADDGGLIPPSPITSEDVVTLGWRHSRRNSFSYCVCKWDTYPIWR